MMGGAKLLIKANGGLNAEAGANTLKYDNWQVQYGQTAAGGKMPEMFGSLTRKYLSFLA